MWGTPHSLAVCVFLGCNAVALRSGSDLVGLHISALVESVSLTALTALQCSIYICSLLVGSVSRLLGQAPVSKQTQSQSQAGLLQSVRNSAFSKQDLCCWCLAQRVCMAVQWQRLQRDRTARIALCSCAHVPRGRGLPSPYADCRFELVSTAELVVLYVCDSSWRDACAQPCCAV
jgi:hypothetical protein